MPLTFFFLTYSLCGRHLKRKGKETPRCEKCKRCARVWSSSQFPSPSISNPCHTGYKKDEHEHKAYAVEPQYDKSQLLGIINDFLRPLIIKYIKKNLDITKHCYCEQISPVPQPFVILRFHCRRVRIETGQVRNSNLKKQRFNFTPSIFLIFSCIILLFALTHLPG